MEGKVIAVAGQIASGKTTLAKYLEETGFWRIVTYTTRPPRENEINSVHYYFLTETEFLERVEECFFAEYTEYNADFGHCYYGTARYNLETPGGVNKVIVLNPDGVISLKKSGYDIFTVCLDFDQVTLMRRALNRGDSPVEITRRIMADAHSFDRMKLDGFIDLHITNPELLPQQIAEMIQNSI